MTNDQLFERWWVLSGMHEKAFDTLAPASIHKFCHAAFHAALSDEDRQQCVWALNATIGRTDPDSSAFEAYRATRRRLEGQE